MDTKQYQKHFLPLESNPEVFTSLIHDLGVPSSFVFRDVFTIEDIKLVPHPALALILAFPTSDTYETERANQECLETHNDLFWFEQTINNACGFYAILHAVTNVLEKELIRPGSVLAEIMDSSPQNRSALLNGSEELESIYWKAARQGNSAVPKNAEDDVDFHFVCFVKSKKDGHIHELDGDKNGPVDKEVFLNPEEDILSESGIRLIREYLCKQDDSLAYSLLVLTTE